MQNKFMNTALHLFIPNIGTLLLVALLLFAYRAWAAPQTPPEVGVTPQARPAAQDATPDTYSYQGYLTDAVGEPINGTLGITFRIYNVPTGGTALWTETRSEANAVPVNNGLFNVHLGSLAPIPASVWKNSVLYLSIQVESDAEMTPRQVIGKLPWLSGDGSWTLPDGSVTTAKLADQAVTAGKIANGAVNSAEIADNSIQLVDLLSGILPVYNVTTSQRSWLLPSCAGDNTFDTDSSYHSIPGLSVNVQGPGTFVIDFTGLGGNNTSERAIYSALFVNGAAIRAGSAGILLGGCRNHPLSANKPIWCTLANSSSVTLDTGSHTIDVRAYCDAGTARVHNGWLRVIKLP